MVEIKIWSTELNILLLLIPLAALSSYLLVLATKKMAPRLNLLDIPNQRSLHSHPVPRGGGLGIVLTFLVLMGIFGFLSGLWSPLLAVLLVSSFLVAALGFLDDLFSLARWQRIVVWLAIGLLVAFSGIRLERFTIPVLGQLDFGALSWLPTILWLVGLTNFYNFMDGINGLAGFQAVIASLLMAFVALVTGNFLVAGAALVILGAAAGFLPHNFPQAGIFLGDVGSTFLGFILAVLSILLSQDEQAVPFVVPVMILLMFLLDALTTLVTRILTGEAWLDPHRDHTYQRLVSAGCSHAQVTLVYAAWSMVLGALAMAYFYGSDTQRSWILALALVPFLLTYVYSRVFAGNSGSNPDENYNKEDHS